MSEIRRYTGNVKECPNGSLTYYQDYAALEAECTRLRDALKQYASKDNWGYFDESGCPKGRGRYESACFIGPDVARQVLGE